MQEAEETPPVFKKWNGWYWLLAGFLVVQIVVFYLITISFS